jgi:starch-binding outer membrane protein, SusD/RagB family
MKTKYIKYILAIIIFSSITSCQKWVAGINNNPNDFTVSSLNAGVFLKGAEINDMQIQLGLLDRAAGFWSGQFIAYEQTEQDMYYYQFSGNSFNWDGYSSVLTPLRLIRKKESKNPLYVGIAKVVEAHLVGTYASLFGDIPYSQALSSNPNPPFDHQKDVFKSLQSLLSSAITDLKKVTASDVVNGDYIFNGNKNKWIESAYTLKARYYMITKQYDSAYAAAQHGISTVANSMMFVPYTAVTDPNSKNTIWERIQQGGTSVGDVPDVDHPGFLFHMLDSLNNAKTDETARMAYDSIDQNSTVNNKGVAAEYEPQGLITCQENLLILAEAGARTQGFATGLNYLNDVRALLASGELFNSSVSGLPMKYDAFVAADFDNGGMENPNNMTPIRALLKQIIGERYVTGFYTLMPYNDWRRLEKSDQDLQVPFPLNTPTQTKNVERFLYPNSELEGNTSAPSDPGAYTPTAVNQ